MKSDDLARLHWIRKQREAKALKAIMAGQSALQHAERAAEGASAAVVDHVGRARERERAALDESVGKALRVHEIVNMQSGFDAAADDQQRLKAAEQRAAEACDARRAELAVARTAFYQHHREAEKLGEIVENRKTALARRTLVLTEAGQDELHPQPVDALVSAPVSSRSEDA